MIFLDLDGTLLNVWERFYRVFCELVGTNDMSLEQYIKIKKELLKDSLVAEAVGHKLPLDYFEKKAILLEEKEFLGCDSLYFPIELIEKLDKENVVILTKRRNASNLYWQLENLNIKIAAEVVQSGSKYQWVSEHYPEERSIIIGDSVVDLEVGRLDNVDVVLAGYGLGSTVEFDNMNVKYEYLETVTEMEEYLWRL